MHPVLCQLRKLVARAGDLIDEIYPPIPPEPPEPIPTLDWNPASGVFKSTIGPTPVFSRASAATMIDVTGKVVWGPENFLLWSNDLVNPAWVTVAATATPGQSDPDGGTSAFLLTPTADATFQQLVTTTAGADYKFSIWVKSATGSNVNLGLHVYNSSLAWVADLPIVATNVWTLFTITATLPGGTSSYFIIGGRSDWTAGENIHVWHPQVSRSASPYLPTTTAPVYGPRITYDPISHQCLGYLAEEQRTNVCLDFIGGWNIQPPVSLAYNTVISPSGLMDGDTFNVGAGTGFKGINSPVMSVAAIATTSVYFKAGSITMVQLLYNDSGNHFANFDIANGLVGSKGSAISSSKITPVGSGWYRAELTTNLAGSTLYIGPIESLTSPWYTPVTIVGNFYAWGPQVESGAFPTSYVPTTTAAVTRSADLCSISGTDFTGFYNQTEGTVAVDTTVPNPDAYRYIYQFLGTGENTLRVETPTTSLSYHSSLPSLLTKAFTSHTKHAMAYGADLAASANGDAVQSMAIGAPLTGLTELHIGKPNHTLSALNGTIARLQYFPVRLPNEKLIELTTPPPPVAVLDWNPASGVFKPATGPTPVFSRASAATMIDVTGKVVWGPENLLLGSSDFSNASYWPTQGINSLAPIIVSNAGLAPDGTMTADRVTFAATTISDRSIIYGTYVGSVATTTMSVWMRAESGTAVVQLTAELSAGGKEFILCNVTTEWQRFSVTRSTAIAGQPYMLIGGDVTVTPAATVLLWGAQMERGSVARTYLPTTTAPVYGPRIAYDPISHQCLGYLAEEQRTNLALYSNQFDMWATLGTVSVAANVSVSPDGTTNADRISFGADAGAFKYLAWSPSASTAYTISVWARVASGAASFRFGYIADGATNVRSADQAVTTAWKRISLSFTTATVAGAPNIGLVNGSAGTAADIEFYGFQVEAGSFPTSYIPTTTAAATRSADLCSITGADFTGFYNQTEGTWVFGAMISDLTTYKGIFCTASAVGFNESAGVDFASNNFSAIVINGGAFQMNHLFGGVSANSLMRGAMAFKINDFATSSNGASPVLDTSGTVPPAERLSIGVSVVGNILNGTIARIQYFQVRLPNEKLIELTTP